MKKISSVLIFSLFLFLACSKAGGENKVKPEPPTPAKSVFEGKNLATFGNSITAAENSWAYQLFKGLKFGNLYNGAVGGAIWSKRIRTAQDGATITTQNYSDPNFAGMSNENNVDRAAFQRIINNCGIVHIQKYLADKAAPVPDFIVLSYGTNDQSTTAVLGNAEGVLKEGNLDNLDLTTIAGAVKWCIKTLQTKFPKAKLYVSLPIQAESVNRNNDNLKKIAVIKKICDGMAVPYFDSFNESGITQANSGQYLRDGLHPNAEGQIIQGNYMIKKLKEANP